MKNREPWLVQLLEQKAEEYACMLSAGTQESRPLVRRLQECFGDDTLIVRLPLPSRLIRALQSAGIDTLGDLNAVSEADLRRWRNVGQASLKQLRKFLALTGRTLPPKPAKLFKRGDECEVVSEEARTKFDT